MKTWSDTKVVGTTRKERETAVRSGKAVETVAVWVIAEVIVAKRVPTEVLVNGKAVRLVRVMNMVVMYCTAGGA